MKAKSVVYYVTLLIFILVPIALGYYILVNTVLARSVLPNVRLNSSDISLYSKEEISIQVSEQALASFPERINVKFENDELSIGASDINLEVDTYDLVNYGKGSNLFKVIAEGINLIKGVEVNVNYTFDTTAFINKLGLNTDQANISTIIGSKYICHKNSYPFTSLNTKTLELDLINSINTNITFEFKPSKYLTDNSEKLIYEACLKYKNDYPKFAKKFIEDLPLNEFKVENLFVLENESNTPIWKVKSLENLGQYIDKYKIHYDILPEEGEYEIINNSEIYLYKAYKEGLNIYKEESISVISNWINSNNFDTNPFVHAAIKPKLLSYGYPIKDFTQQIGMGNTRIELERDGFDNIVLAYTMFGLDEINREVINAGEEFSYIKTIDPQPNGTTKSGRPIASGICNSTTTLFRAVLEAGLPVKDRSYHAYYVPSYEWGYPLNIVDAAYYTNPKVDFKFKNNSEYPILIRIEYSKDSDYQYNTVKILTSSNFEKRTVELTNWKIWDKFSSTNFKGSFDRIVSTNGQVLFQDNFFSHYL